MMIRFLLVILMILTGIGLYAYKHPRNLILVHDYFTTRQQEITSQETSISLTYELDSTRWTEFQIPQATNRIRVISNCVVPADYQPELQDLQGGVEKLPYSLYYQLYDADENIVIKDGEYHFKTKLTLSSEASDQPPEQAAFFKEKDQLPTDGRVMVFDLKGMVPEAGDSRIRFKTGELCPGSTGQVIRVYAQQQLNGTNDGERQWSRLLAGRREKLAKGNIYPQDLLTPSEISSLLHNKWLPVGPKGIPGRDFEARRMYVLRDLGDNSPETPAALPALKIVPGSPFTFAVTEDGQAIRLQFAPADQEQRGKGTITIRWYGLLVHENLSWELPWDGLQQAFYHNFAGGLVEVEADIPLALTLQDGITDGSEIVPLFFYSKMSILQPGSELSYAIRHIGSYPTPIRITVRKPNDETGREGFRLHYTLVGKNGDRSGERTLYMDAAPSRYDQPTGDLYPLGVSEPVSHYLHLPPDVSGLELHSEVPLLVTVANSLPDQPQEVRVPEEYYRSSLDTSRLPRWFSFPPKAPGMGEAGSETVLVKLQHRPPEREDDLLAGRYLWESFRPSGPWHGSYLFSPKDPASPYRSEALASTYHRIRQGAVTIQKVTAAEGVATVKPNLIFIRDESDLERLNISIDGQPYYSKNIRGTRGQLSLPPLPAGTHTISISGEAGADFFLSNLESGEKPHTLRFAYHLGADGLQFTYTKKLKEELLSFYYYAPEGRAERTRLRVRIEASPTLGGPFSGITERDRLFDIRPAKEPPLPVLHSRTKNTDAGQRFFFPLQEDLPPGQYTIRVEPESQADGFILMYRVTPGDYEWNRILREEN